MYVALQLPGVYLLAGFVAIIGARIVAGTAGARRTARFVLVGAPVWLVTSTFWLLVECVTFLLPRRPPGRQTFIEEPIMAQAATPPPQDNTLEGKLARMQREQLDLIIALTAGLVPAHELRRAFELGLINEVAVQRQFVFDHELSAPSAYPVTAVNFVLRAPAVLSDEH